MNIPVEIKPEPFGRREEVAFHDRKPVLERGREREKERKAEKACTRTYSLAFHKRRREVVAREGERQLFHRNVDPS